MASIRKQIQINAHPDAVWDAIRDFGVVRTRLVRGFVVDTMLDGESRIVTFASGAVQREPLVDSEDGLRWRSQAAACTAEFELLCASCIFSADGGSTVGNIRLLRNARRLERRHTG
jgi:hypothetical protein